MAEIIRKVDALIHLAESQFSKIARQQVFEVLHREGLLKAGGLHEIKVYGDSRFDLAIATAVGSVYNVHISELLKPLEGCGLTADNLEAAVARHCEVDSRAGLSAPGYESLAGVLHDAFEQASEGKGKERHATEKSFEEQSMQVISDLLDSPDGMAYQVIKKVRESSRLPHDARRRELLGAIIYAAGIVLYHDRAAGQGGAHD